MKTNKNSATEDDVGGLHKIVTKLFMLKADEMLREYQRILESGTEDEKAGLQYVIDTRDLNAMAKWVTSNDMGSLPADQDETSELSKKLRKLKSVSQNKVIAFIEPAVGE